jgi:hypothetical protein
LAICACFSWSLALDAFEHVSQERLAFRVLLGESFPVDMLPHAIRRFGEH